MKKLLYILGCVSVVLHAQNSFAALTDSACDDMYQSYVESANLCGTSGHIYLDRTTYKSQCCSFGTTSSTGSSQANLHQNTSSPCYPCRSAGGGGGSTVSGLELLQLNMKMLQFKTLARNLIVWVIVQTLQPEVLLLQMMRNLLIHVRRQENLLADV